MTPVVTRNRTVVHLHRQNPPTQRLHRTGLGIHQNNVDIIKLSKSRTEKCRMESSFTESRESNFLTPNSMAKFQ